MAFLGLSQFPRVLHLPGELLKFLYQALVGETKCLHLVCHAPNPGPTRLADPNRFSGRETQDWDSLPDFNFFFFLKQN